MPAIFSSLFVPGHSMCFYAIVQYAYRYIFDMWALYLALCEVKVHVFYATKRINKVKS